MKRISLIVASLLLAATARAEQEGTRSLPWAIAARTAWAVMGPAARQTGGLMVSAEGTRAWVLSERWSLLAGAELALWGMDGGGRWTAIQGGPLGAARARIAGPFSAGLAVHLDCGRLATCNAWGLCFNSSGFFPAAAGSLRYSPSDRVAFEITGGVRWVNTLPWSGAGADRLGFRGVVAW